VYVWHTPVTPYVHLLVACSYAFTHIYTTTHIHILAIIRVFALPPRLSLRSHVNTESRYGMYMCRWRRGVQSPLQRFTSTLLPYDHEDVSHDCMIDLWADSLTQCNLYHCITTPITSQILYCGLQHCMMQLVGTYYPEDWLLKVKGWPTAAQQIKYGRTGRSWPR